MDLQLDFGGHGLLFALILLVGLVLITFTHLLRHSESRQGWLWFLRGLRLLSWLLLILVLFQPQLAVERRVVQEKEVLLLLDDSRSMQSAWVLPPDSLDPAAVAVLNDLDLRQNLETRFMDGRDWRSGEPVTFESASSSLDIRALGKTDELNQSQAVLLISDGHFNAGLNPLDADWTKQVPLYPVLLSKPAESRNVRIQKIQVPTEIKAGKPTRVRTHLKQSGFTGEALVLSAWLGDRLVHREDLLIPEEGMTAAFDLTLQDEGTQQLAVRLEHPVRGMRDEKRVELEVEPERTRVWILADAVSPLHRFLHRAIPDSVYNITWITLPGIPLPGSNEIGFPAGSPDLLILINAIDLVQTADFPGERLSAAGVPTIVFNTRGAPTLPSFYRQMGFSPQTLHATDPRTVFGSDAGYDHPLGIAYRARVPDRGGLDWADLPPIQLPAGVIRLSGITLAQTMFQGAVIPVLTLGSNAPVLVFNGEGFWRWFFRPPGEKVFSTYWETAVAYLLHQAEFQPVRLTLLSDKLSVGAPIQGEIYVTDIDGRAVRDVQVTLFEQLPDQSDAQAIPVQRIEAGRHTFRINLAQAGEHQLRAQANRSGKKWGADTLAFQVTAFNPEAQVAGIDMNRLSALAQQSGGRVLRREEVSGFTLPVETIEETRIWRFRGIRSLAVLVILITLLGIEWAWRRRRGLL